MKAKKKKKTQKKQKLKGKRVHPLIQRYILQRVVIRGQNKKGKNKKKSVTEDEFSEFEMLRNEEPLIFLNPEVIGQNEEIICLKLNRDAQEALECIIGEDLVLENNWKYVHRDKILTDIMEKGDESPFYALLDSLRFSQRQHILVIFDKNLLAYYLFFSLSPISHMKNLTVKAMKCIEWLKVGNRRGLRELIHFRSTQAKAIARTLIREKVGGERNRIKIILFENLEPMELRVRNLSSVEAKDLKTGYINTLMRRTKSEEEIYRMIPIIKSFKFSGDSEFESEYEGDGDWVYGVRDFNDQVLPEVSKIFSQTYPPWILRNKTTQWRLRRMMSKRRFYRTYGKVLFLSEDNKKFLSWNMQESKTQHICADFNGGSMRIAARKKNYLDNFRLSEPFDFVGYHTSGIAGIARERCVIALNTKSFANISCMAWHPKFIDIVAVAHRGTILFDRRLFYVEEDEETEEDLIFRRETFPYHEIIEWKITEQLPKATRQIYCDCEIRHLHYNVDYPTLLAGSTTCGHVLVWDMNSYSVPESVFISYMASIFSSRTVPWIYTPPSIAYITIEGCDVFSHRGHIYDMQWMPSNSVMVNDGSIDISGETRSGVIVTASGDGTVGVWNLAFPHPNTKYRRCIRRRVWKACPEIPPFDQYDRHFQPQQFVLASMNRDPVPITALSMNNVRQWAIPGDEECNYFKYESMRNALKKQRPMMHACITCGLANGQIIGFLPDLWNYEMKKGLEHPDFYKYMYFVPERDGHIQYQCFKHEGVVLCIKRSHFADDLMLSISGDSFCIWKEQSKLYKKRRERMPWIQSLYPDCIHGPPVNPRITPLWWKRVFRAEDWYMNGEWSSLRASQFFLLVSTGEVEIYDVNMSEDPILVAYIGNHVLHHVLPLVFSSRTDEIAFIEDESFYFCKMPTTCRLKSASLVKNLTKFASFGAWRRYYYSTWCELLYQEVAEFVQRRKAIIEATIYQRRYDALRKVFEVVRLRRAKSKKELPDKKHDRYYQLLPEAWWEELKYRGIRTFLQRKKNFMHWEEWEDVIEDLDDRELRVFNQLTKVHTFAYMPLRRALKERYLIRCHFALKEYFQQYWDMRYEQQHLYDHLFLEDYGEDSQFAVAVDTGVEEAKTSAPFRKKEYGMLYEFIGMYESERVRDLGILTPRKDSWERIYPWEVLACYTMFSHYMNDVHVKKLLGKIPGITHESNMPDAAPTLNKVSDLWEIWEHTGTMPMYYRRGVDHRRGALDLTYLLD